MGYRILCCLCFCWLLSGCAQAGDTDARMLTVRGTLSAVSPDALQLRERHGGELMLRMTPATRLFGVFSSSLDDIRPGAFLGAVALPLADGTLEAQTLHLFSDRLRGAGEGHTPWRLVSGEQGSMTNGTVDVGGTWRGDGDVAGQPLVLRYGGGTQQIRVGLQTPVVFVDSLTRGALRPGQAAVLILTVREGRATAEVLRAFVGIYGVIPPF
ncbi:hypothetical protein F8538_14855 [Edwardsiella ictaluri]|uniref:hypothetical protein n=1 Tax=Edwardsiella ictaluri TaxID=67780 RepID=UPI0009BEC666|nr:hypothetical protein [Edwardsiella ictaluri]ARD39488.1 hypothetical protein B6E78_08985 [Edwardsiella ictaluri]QPW27913.1 hypothetical protein F8538_14855 [Edwardsiella ictaluri]